MPGTRPSRRTARAAPLPAFARAVALSSLTLAMVSQPIELKRASRSPADARPRLARLYRQPPGNTRKGVVLRLRGRGGAGAGHRLERLDARPQGFVLLAGEACHLLDGLELLALD